MLLSKAEHWKAKQMLFFKKFASLSFQLGMKIFHTTHFKSSCLPQYLIERKLESYNHVKFAPLFPPWLQMHTEMFQWTIVATKFVIRIKHRLAHQSDRKVKLTITVWPLLRALRLKVEQARANEHKPGAQTGGIKSADQKDEIIHKQLSFFRFYIPYFFWPLKLTTSGQEDAWIKIRKCFHRRFEGC